MFSDLTMHEAIPIETCGLYHFLPGTTVWHLTKPPGTFSEIEEAVSKASIHGCSSIFIPPETHDEMALALATFAREEGLAVISSLTHEKQPVQHLDAALVVPSSKLSWGDLRQHLLENNCWFEIILPDEQAPILKEVGDLIPVHGDATMPFMFAYTKDYPHTICPGCSHALMTRSQFGLITNRVRNGRCMCGESIPGVWE